MKTYPHQENGEIIELVRKDEHDAVVRELNERLTKQQADMLDTIVQLRAELTSWQAMAERLATALNNLIDDCKTHSKDIQNIRWGYDGDGGATLSSEQIEECCDAAKLVLAAYESATKGELPEVKLWCSYCGVHGYHTSGSCPQIALAEAVKRMEAVQLAPLPVDYVDVESVRAHLISAAKGEQP